jgi:MoxR-like ATPase
MLATNYWAIAEFLFRHIPKVTPLIVGPTGIGKTEIPERLYVSLLHEYEKAKNTPASERTEEQKAEVAKGNIGFAYLNFTACEFADLVGLPFREGDKTIYCPPEWLKNIENYPRGIAVFDEVNRVELQTRQAYMQILDRRQIGNVRIPPGWLIIQTANPADDAYQVSDFDKALVRRSAVMELSFDLDTWQTFGLREYVSPISGDHLNSRVLAVSTRLANQGLVQKVENQVKPIPTAAGLTLCGEVLDAGADKYLSRESREALLAGLIGATAATMLEASLKDDRLKGLLEKALKGEPMGAVNIETQTDLMFLFFDAIAKSATKYGKQAFQFWEALHSNIKPVFAKACYPWFSKHKDQYSEFRRAWGKWCLDNMYVMQAILDDEDAGNKKK